MKRLTKKSAIIVSFCLLVFTACASQRPVLYPNDYMRQVGTESAQEDIDLCMRLATEYGARSSAGREITRDTAENAAIGGATGAAAGAVFGDLGKGAAAGAAGAGAATVARGIFRSGRHDPVFRGFVERCLRDKGYETIGWE
jgi:hypothetical protein